MALGVDLVDVAAQPRQEFDWSDLSPSAIASSTWAITPSGPTISQPLIDALLTSVEISGLAWGGVYRLVNTVTTDSGEIEVQSITLYGGKE